MLLDDFRGFLWAVCDLAYRNLHMFPGHNQTPELSNSWFHSFPFRNVWILWFCPWSYLISIFALLSQVLGKYVCGLQLLFGGFTAVWRHHQIKAEHLLGDHCSLLCSVWSGHNIRKPLISPWCKYIYFQTHHRESGFMHTDHQRQICHRRMSVHFVMVQALEMENCLVTETISSSESIEISTAKKWQKSTLINT